VLDLGTGTGAIALALASERSDWQVTACDCVDAAVSVAQRNAHELGLPVIVLNSFWFSDLEPQTFNLIVSNPPYIASQDHHLREGDVRFEPLSALVSGADGLDDLRLIIKQAPRWLENEGWLLVEHGFDQAEVVRLLFQRQGFVAVESRKDYGHHERVTLGQWVSPDFPEPRNTGSQNVQ
jgi:release factor glutamine methyltransferase